MRLIPCKWSGKLSQKPVKKTVLGSLKTGTKSVGAGMIMGAGAEIAGHVFSKAQAQGVDEGSQYVMIEDLGPSFTRFNWIDTTTDGSGPCWYPGLRNVLSLGFSIVLFFMLVVTICKCGLKRCAKKSCLTKMCQQVTHS